LRGFTGRGEEKKTLRPGKAGLKGVTDAVVTKFSYVVQQVRNLPDQGIARQVGSEPCDDGGNDVGDA
jgi:hypothetical protein